MIRVLWKMHLAGLKSTNLLPDDESNDRFQTLMIKFGIHSFKRWPDVLEELNALGISGFYGIQTYILGLTGFNVKYASNYSSFKDNVAKFGGNMTNLQTRPPNTVSVFITDMQAQGYDYDSNQDAVNLIMDYFTKCGFTIQTYSYLPNKKESFTYSVKEGLPSSCATIRSLKKSRADKINPWDPAIPNGIPHTLVNMLHTFDYMVNENAASAYKNGFKDIFAIDPTNIQGYNGSSDTNAIRNAMICLCISLSLYLTNTDYSSQIAAAYPSVKISPIHIPDLVVFLYEDEYVELLNEIKKAVTGGSNRFYYSDFNMRANLMMDIANAILKFINDSPNMDRNNRSQYAYLSSCCAFFPATMFEYICSSIYDGYSISASGNPISVDPVSDINLLDYVKRGMEGYTYSKSEYRSRKYSPEK